MVRMCHESQPSSRRGRSPSRHFGSISASCAATGRTNFPKRLVRDVRGIGGGALRPIGHRLAQAAALFVLLFSQILVGTPLLSGYGSTEPVGGLLGRLLHAKLDVH